MKKVFRVFLAGFFLAISFIKINAIQSKNEMIRVIHIAGIVMEATSFSPIEHAKLYDEKGNFIATTDSKGYFNGKLNCATEEEIHFKIKIKKSGYSSFIQAEHWGNLRKEISSIYYFGMQKQKNTSGNTPFSEMGFNKNLSYESALAGFEGIKEKLVFNRKLEAVKINNQNIFFTLGQDYYLMSDTGWLKIDSPNDRVAINKSQIIKASEINSVLKRKQIRQMTPSESKDFSFELYVK